MQAPSTVRPGPFVAPSCNSSPSSADRGRAIIMTSVTIFATRKRRETTRVGGRCLLA